MCAQIGVDHALIVLNVFRRAGGQHLAMRQTIDFVCHVHDDPHIVLDHQQRDAEIRAEIDVCVSPIKRLIKKLNKIFDDFGFSDVGDN